MTTFSLPGQNFAIILERVGAVEIREPYHPTQAAQQPDRFGHGYAVVVVFTDGGQCIVQSWPERARGNRTGGHIDTAAEKGDFREAQDVYWKVLRSLGELREAR